jgi:NADH:ubiquinone oxidoreductase subunit 3 (subunit A)
LLTGGYSAIAGHLAGHLRTPCWGLVSQFRPYRGLCRTHGWVSTHRSAIVLQSSEGGPPCARSEGFVVLPVFRRGLPADPPKMFSSEFLFLAASCLQPLVVGFAAFAGLGRQATSADLAQSLATVDQKLGAFRFYECASYSRLGSLLRYNISFFSILVAFIIYDVDFIFLFSELLMLSGYGAACWFVLAFFVLCLVVGLWYDYSAVGYSWYAS